LFFIVGLEGPASSARTGPRSRIGYAFVGAIAITMSGDEEEMLL